MGNFHSLSKSSTEFWLSASEWALLIFGIMLVFGVIGEFIAEREKKKHSVGTKRKGMLETFDNPSQDLHSVAGLKLRKTFSEVLVIVAVCGELLSDGGIFLFGRQLQIVSDAETANANKSAAEANAMASSAQLESELASKKAAVANREAGMANERAALLESNNLTFRSNIMEMDRQLVETKIELAKANERAALTESNSFVLKKEVAQLEIKLLQTGSNISKIDPLNLPIVLAEAEASVLIVATNSLRGLRVPRNEIEAEADLIFADLLFKDPDVGDFPVRLECEKMKIMPMPKPMPWIIINLKFKSLSLKSEWLTDEQAKKWGNLTAEKFDRFKQAEISIPGLWDKSELRGVCLIRLNSTISKTFWINPQSVGNKMILRAMEK